MGNPLTKQVTQQGLCQSREHRRDVLRAEEPEAHGFFQILVDLWKCVIFHRTMQTEIFLHGFEQFLVWSYITCM